MIQVHGLTEAQRVIADLLWGCDTMDEVQLVVDKLGHQARVVLDLIVLAAGDEEVEKMTSYPAAEAIIAKIKG